MRELDVPMAILEDQDSEVTSLHRVSFRKQDVYPFLPRRSNQFLDNLTRQSVVSSSSWEGTSDPCIWHLSCCTDLWSVYSVRPLHILG